MGMATRTHRLRGFGLALTILWCLWTTLTVAATEHQQENGFFSFFADGAGIQLGGPSIAPQILVAPNDLPGVLRVVNDLATDFGKVLGTNSTVKQADWKIASADKDSTKPIVIVGTRGQSSLIDGLVAAGKLDDAASLAGKRETYLYRVVANPWVGRDAALVVVGSDMRGTIYGAYDISEQIGVSPLWWWADVPPTKRQYIFASAGAAVAAGPPSVKYRGLFLNDESPCLTGWGGANFKQSQYGSPFVTEFYKHIFELVLRLKGNYVWPAMWSSMFYLDDANNGPTATQYGVFMGTSHHEPMARADKEQNRFLKGSWDWKSNKAGVQAFMEEGVTRSKNWSAIYTLGMRGSGDAASATLTSSALEEVIHWQQSTLTRVLGRPLGEIPQVWVMYKEVPGYWQNGMNVSADVTLLWSDDNRGNIRRIPLANETARAGGSGIYYHFDYVGDPRNYKWINSVQLQKTWEQMTLAYDRGIQDIWIVNVGDLKAQELPLSHFMAIAWDRSSFSGPNSTREWLTAWAGRQFGDDAASSTSSIMTTYGRLTARMKYEDLSRTPFAFSTVNYDEAEKNLAEWSSLVDRTQGVYDSLPAATQTSFFEMVLHPVLAGKTVYEIYTKTAIGAKYAGEHRMSTARLAKEVQAAFAQDGVITKRFHSLLNGRWNHMMDQIHIGYNNWQDPGSNSMPKQSTVSGSASGGLLGVTTQGVLSFFPTAKTLTTLPMSPYVPATDQRYIEVFLRDTGSASYTVSSNVSYLTTTNAKGTLDSTGNLTDARCLLAVDWTATPSGSSAAALTITAGSTTASVLVPLANVAVPPDFHGHVEATGVVSIEAESFDRAASSADAYVVVPDYGRTLSGVRLPPTHASQTAGQSGAAVLVYPFFIFSSAAAATITVYLSPSENSNPVSPNRLAFSVDGAATPTVVQPVPLANAGSEPSGWSDGVIAGAYVKTVKVGSLAAGKHELRVWLLEPTMALTKLVVDVGGLRSSLMGPPESVRVGAT